MAFVCVSSSPKKDMSLSHYVVTITAVALVLSVEMRVATAIQLLQPSGELGVYALPVGQGDCTVIQCPKPSGNIMLVDCGTTSSGHNQFSLEDVKNFLGSQITKVVAIMITHPDLDHFKYISKITWNNSPAVIIGGKLQDYYRRNNRDFLEIYNFLIEANKAGKLHTINNAKICIGNCAIQGLVGTDFCNNRNIKFHILAANVRRPSNQKSIVMKIVVGGWSMLLSGDMEGSAATQIARSPTGRDLQSTVYKMSHHGASSQANRKTWLDAIKPKYAFVSSGYNYGNNRHPRCDAIKRLLSLNTIASAESHYFYCGNKRDAPPTIDTDFQWNIYETSPRSDEMCVLAYFSSEEFQQRCGKRTAAVSAVHQQTEGEMSMQEAYAVASAIRVWLYS